jgi:signal transduction histidine kinase
MAPVDDDDLTRWARAAAGDVAVDVAAELAAPLADLRDRLAMLADRIDRHVAYQTGPEPYPWKQLQALRQDLASAYLETTSMSRLASDLGATIAALGNAPVEIDDLGHLVEAGVQLARHRIGPRTELLVDIGSVPRVRAPAGELTLAVAKMIAVCARSAHPVEKSALSVRCRLEADGVVITASDNGGGAPEAAAELALVLAPFAQRHGGSFDGASPLDQGSVFELRLPPLPYE